MNLPQHIAHIRQLNDALRQTEDQRAYKRSHSSIASATLVIAWQFRQEVERRDAPCNLG